MRGEEKEKVTREVGEVSLFPSFPLTLWHEAFVPGKPTHNLLGVPFCESTCVCRRVCVCDSMSSKDKYAIVWIPKFLERQENKRTLRTGWLSICSTTFFPIDGKIK